MPAFGELVSAILIWLAFIVKPDGPHPACTRVLRAAATFEGEFSELTRSYAGKGVVRYAWRAVQETRVVAGTE